LEENAMVLICKRVLHDWKRMPWYLYVKEYSMIGGVCKRVLHDWRRMPWYLYVKEYSMIGGECHGTYM
jgi:hypothetical protein